MENTSKCGERSGKAVVMAVLLTFSTFYLNICVFVDRGNLAASIQPVISVQKESSWSVYLYGVTSLQIVHSFVVVQDGTAIISVVLQIDPTVRRAGLCSFSSGPQPSFSSDQESALHFSG